jgi:PAS domain S-box-containing protein
VVGGLLLATLLRWVFGPTDGLPFITYYPAVTIIALVAGFWPGIVSAIVAAALALILFVPPYSWGGSNPYVWSGVFFLAMSGIVLGVILLLHRAVDLLIVQEQNIRDLLEAAPTGIVVVDDAGRIKLLNRTAERLFGYRRDEMVGQTVEALLPERHATSHTAVRGDYHKRPEARPMGAGRELSGRRKDGTEFSVEVGLTPLRAGKDHNVVATVIDITERLRSLEHERLLSRELQHRTQNLFAVIQSIAERTLVDGASKADAKAVFDARLRALSAAHRLLAEGGWEGAPLREIIASELSGFTSNVRIEE